MPPTLPPAQRWATRAPALGSLASADWWPQQGAYLPAAQPEWILREAIRDIFQVTVGRGGVPRSMPWAARLLQQTAGDMPGAGSNPAPAIPAHPAAARAPCVACRGVGGLANQRRGAAWLPGQGSAARRADQQVRMHARAHAAGLPRGVWHAKQLAGLPPCTMWALHPRCRFTLHALALGSPRAVAELWSRFVATLRLTYWEQLQALPRMRLGGAPQQAGSGSSGGASSSSGSSRPDPPDLQLSLLHQKLQLLDLCIHLHAQRQQQQQQQQQDGLEQSSPQAARREGRLRRQQEAGSSQASSAALEWESSWGDEMEAEEAPASPTSSSSSYHSAGPGSDVTLSPAKEPQAPAEDGAGAAALEPQGVAGVLQGATLHLHPGRPLRVPVVQDPPVQTEDLMAEEQAALQVGACCGAACCPNLRPRVTVRQPRILP